MSEPAANPEPKTQDQPPAQNNSGQQGQAGTAPQRPDWLPEKFWDGEKGQPRVEGLAKSYAEVERLVAKRATELDTEDYKKFAEQHFQARRADVEKEVKASLRQGVPGKAEEYQPVISQDAVPDWEGDRDLAEHLKDDPAFHWFRQYAHESGLSQPQFEKGLAGFMKSFGEYHAQQYEAEKRALGENADQRISHIQGALQAQLGDKAAGLAQSIVSAAQVEALEALLAKIPGGTGRVTPADDAGQGASGKRTLAELRTMMQDERYWHPNRADPAFRAEVEAGFKALGS